MVFAPTYLTLWSARMSAAVMSSLGSFSESERRPFARFARGWSGRGACIRHVAAGGRAQTRSYILTPPSPGRPPAARLLTYPRSSAPTHLR